MSTSGVDSNSTDFPAIQEGVRELITERLLETDEMFGAESNLFDAGLDSMAIMQMLLLLEERFGVMVPQAALTKENFRTVHSIAKLVAERISAGTA